MLRFTEAAYLLFHRDHDTDSRHNCLCCVSDSLACVRILYLRACTQLRLLSQSPTTEQGMPTFAGDPLSFSGVTLVQDGDEVVVGALAPGAPQQVKLGDKLLRVNGQSTVGMRIDQAITVRHALTRKLCATLTVSIIVHCRAGDSGGA